MIWMHLT